MNKTLSPNTTSYIFCILCIIVFHSAISPLSAENLGNKQTHMWEYIEYSLDNPTWSGNPFDLEATVTFTHDKEQHVTGMFYVGNNTWNFRFTGTRTGQWKFTTSSHDKELNGHTGSITVTPRTSPRMKGFLSHVGNKYAIMEEDINDLQGYIYQVFMNQQDYEQQYKHPTRIPGHPSKIKLIDDYWNNTQENGFNIYFFAVFYSWFKMGALSIDDFSNESDPELEQPDLALFDTLEYAITYAHQRGGRTHIWAWGDNGRKQTPNHISGGFRGKKHQRLIRYIAARLGPLPGWSMNFGFDTIEMPNAEEDTIWWTNQLNQKMGWPHILTSRGWEDKSFGANSYAGFGGNPYDLETTDKGPATYQEIKQDMETHKDKPSIYEERHTYNRWQCWPHRVQDPNRLNETGCRRLIWWEALAGGMGGFFGHFSERFNAYGPFKPNGPCGYHPESLKQTFRTYQRFWNNGRLKLSMTPDNNRVNQSNAYCLASQDKKHFIFFIENADSITINLDGMPGKQPIIAVNAQADYTEIDKGILNAGIHKIPLKTKSDWAIAVGNFND